MISIQRLTVLVLAVVLGWSALSPPVRAQQGASGRFMFADTTLLRDTLDLGFVALFPLAESLRVTPDTLRALSIRYLMPIERLAFLADSLSVPVDSVGPVLGRERFNPLSMTGTHVTDFAYSTMYTIDRQRTSWTNSSDYQLARGPLTMRNVTTVRIDRIRQGTGYYFNRAKSANTELGWKLSPDFAVGGRVNLQSNENLLYNRTTSTNEYQFSVRSRQQPRRNVNTEANLFGGPYNEPNSIPVKRGFGSRLDGRVGYTSGSWLGVDVSGLADLRLGRSQLSGRDWFSTRDFSGNAAGTLSMFQSSPASLLINFSGRTDRQERPDTVRRVFTLPLEGPGAATVDTVIRDRSGAASVDVALQIRRGSRGSITVTGRASRSSALIAVGREGRYVFDLSTSDDLSYGVQAHYQWAGWALETSFSDGRPQAESPRRTQLVIEDPDPAKSAVLDVDYRERQKSHTRSIQADVSRSFTRAITLKANGRVALNSFRFMIPDDAYLAQSRGLPVPVTDPREDWRQSYRIDAIYSRPRGISSAVGVEVQRALSLYLRAAQSASNREDRIYRADWRWTYGLMRGLTATQRNQISASYTRNIYAPQKNRLGLSYLTITTLNASLTPRLALDLTHNTNYRPNGDYLRAADGLDYFNPSDANHDYTLSGRAAYTPISSLSIWLEPYYQATDRAATSSGQVAPQQRRRALNFTGGASVNLGVAGRGRLTGSLSRRMESSRNTTYTSGVPRAEPRVGSDFWHGSLQFSWSL